MKHGWNKDSAGARLWSQTQPQRSRYCDAGRMFRRRGAYDMLRLVRCTQPRSLTNGPSLYHLLEVLGKRRCWGGLKIVWAARIRSFRIWALIDNQSV